MTLLSSAYVYASLPRAGLGNMLFVWARAEVFAYINQIPLFTSSWTQLRLGPILRAEKSKRLYWRYFTNISSIPYWHQWWAQLRYTRIVEPRIEVIPPDSYRQNCLYVFNENPHWANYFAGIQDYREHIRNRLWQMLNPAYQNMIEASPLPCIAVHVRRGDFRELQVGEDFTKVGLVRTPLKYFGKLIREIREVYGARLPVTIFSDGSAEELQELLQIPGVTLSLARPDIVDLWLLAKSRLLITSAGSTFSYWAAFLSDAPVLLHPDHIHGRIRPLSAENALFEGGVRGSSQDWPAQLIENIKTIVLDNQTGGGSND
jgi:hypothetical protein